ncbi:glycosyltransferase family 2 protein [bacterium]|nr:glycosyltransferase family 2 protein [bacterium]
MVCTYNRLIFLEKCLNSLILQDYNTYEIIVVDD